MRGQAAQHRVVALVGVGPQAAGCPGEIGADDHGAVVVFHALGGVGGWSQATIKRIIVTRVIKPHFTVATPVWPDDDYPERIGIDVLDEQHTIHGTTLGADAMEVLRLSANKQGAAVLRPDAAALTRLVDALPPVPAPAGEGSIDHDGADSVVAQVLIRREQAKPRSALLGAATAWCGVSTAQAFTARDHAGTGRRCRCPPNTSSLPGAPRASTLNFITS